MSKISEQKALEEYPKASSPYYGDNILDRNINCRAGYIKGYDQAMQDFLERACEWWENTLEYNPGTQYILKSFKNYIQNESEN